MQAAQRKPSVWPYSLPSRHTEFPAAHGCLRSCRRSVNAQRLREAVRLRKAVYKNGVPTFASSSYDSTALSDPSIAVDYLIAPPRMAYYEKVSRQIYGIYLKYIAPEDIVVYSIDECFFDLISYLSHYHMSAHDLVKTMIREVLYTTGITATAGIGSKDHLKVQRVELSEEEKAKLSDTLCRLRKGQPVSVRYFIGGYYEDISGTVEVIDSIASELRISTGTKTSLGKDLSTIIPFGDILTLTEVTSP